MSLATLQTRIKRIERYQRRPIHGRRYILRNGAERILSYQQAAIGFHDVACRIDSPEARIIRNAVTDSDGGAMLQLLRACLNPMETKQWVP